MMPRYSFEMGLRNGNKDKALQVDAKEYDLQEGQQYEVEDMYFQVFESESQSVISSSPWSEEKIGRSLWDKLVRQGEKPNWLRVTRVEDEPLALYSKFRIGYQAIHGDKGTGIIAMLIIMGIVWGAGFLVSGIALLVYGPEALGELVETIGDVAPSVALPAGLILGAVVLIYLMFSGIKLPTGKKK